MEFKQNNLFYTPQSQEELVQRVTALAENSKDAMAVWTAVMMFQNFVAAEQVKERLTEQA